VSAHRVLGSRTAFFIAAAVLAGIVGVIVLGQSGGGASKQRTPAAFVPLAEYSEQAPHVNSRLTVIAIQGSVRHQASVPGPDQPPISAASFKRPVAEYLAYSVRQLTLMQQELGPLDAALQSGDLAASEAQWKVVWSRYLHLGGVYLQGPVAELNDEIDGGAGGLQGGTSNPHFIGLHRIEFGLWSGQAPQTLLAYARGLATNVARLKALLPHTAIDPLDFATRTHEILEDAIRDLLSGADVPWSKQGVLGTSAGLAATRELMSTLLPLLHEPAAMAADPPANPRSPAVVDADLGVLQNVLDSLARDHDGQLPTNTQMTQDQSERLNAAVSQAVYGLAQVPGMLETVNAPTIPNIPRSGVKIDP
jgi:iron uptake system EfeUOB component EfeO/EfeM